VQAVVAHQAAGAAGYAADATKNTEAGFGLKLPANRKLQNAYDSNDTSRTYEYGDGNANGLPSS